jgi:hypothetical protein
MIKLQNQRLNHITAKQNLNKKSKKKKQTLQKQQWRF